MGSASIATKFSKHIYAIYLLNDGNLELHVSDLGKSEKQYRTMTVAKKDFRYGVTVGPTYTPARDAGIWCDV